MPAEPNRAPQADEHADGLPDEPRHQQQTGGHVPQTGSDAGADKPKGDTVTPETKER